MSPSCSWPACCPTLSRWPLLTDFGPHGAVARAYGIFREGDGYSECAVLVLDGEGVVRFSKVYLMSQAPDVQEILGALRGL